MSSLTFTDPTYLAFGGDWPYATAQTSRHFTQNLDAYNLDEASQTRINRGNAQALGRFLAWKATREFLGLVSTGAPWRDPKAAGDKRIRAGLAVTMRRLVDASEAGVD